MSGKLAYLIFSLIVPPLVTFGVLWATRDAITTMISLLVFYFLLCNLYDTFFGLFRWNWYIGRDKEELKRNFGKGKIISIS